MTTILRTTAALAAFAALSGCVYEPAYVRHDGYRGGAYYSGRYDARPDAYYYDYDYWPGYYGYAYPSIGIGVRYDHVRHHRSHDRHGRDHHHRR